MPRGAPPPEVVVLEFCQIVTRAVWTALGVHQTVPANQPLDRRFFGYLLSNLGNVGEWQRRRVGGFDRN